MSGLKGFRVCCHGPRSIECFLDNVNHLLGLHLRFLCDRHDAYIMGER